MTKVFVLGCPTPGRVGGANGEMLGAVSLWLKRGLDVGVIPTWNGPGKEVTDQLENMGCSVHLPGPRLLHTVEGFPGSTVVSFCNENAFLAKRQMAKMNCRFIVAPLMCYLRPGMVSALKENLISGFIFQSEYQKSVLLPQAKQYGLDKFHLVRGYIDWEKIKFAPRPHAAGEPFVIGRASRARASKWSKHWWKMYEEVPDRQAILLGVSPETVKQIGRAPSWGKIYKPGAISIESFWPQLHAHVTCNDMDLENRPRTGLECMAYGVPTCAENRGGWAEMLEHGVTGMLGDSPQKIGRHAATLAKDEDLRMTIATEARRRLETDIANPDLVWEQWREVLGLPCETVYGVSPIQYTLPPCADCGGPIGQDNGPSDGWQLEDGRTVCQKCCAKDLNPLANQVDEPEVQKELSPEVRASLEYAVRQIAIATQTPDPEPLVIHIRPEDVHKLTPDVQEQLVLPHVE